MDRMTRLRRSPSLWPLLIAFAGCAPRTEVVIALATDLQVPAQLDSIEIIVQGGVTTAATDVPIPLTGSHMLPGSIGIGPGADPNGPIDITVRGLLARQIVVERRASLHFVSGHTLFLRLTLSAACYGAAKQVGFCPDMQWCAEGQCRPINVDPTTLPEYNSTVDQPQQAQCGTDYAMYGLQPPTISVCPTNQYCSEAQCISGVAPPVLDMTGMGPLLDGGMDAAPPDLSLPDVAMPDSAMPDYAMPDYAMPDFAMPHANPDLVMTMSLPDQTDTSIPPDQTMSPPDLALPDFALPDFSLPDFSLPDFSLPDFSLPDFSLPDFVPPQDLVAPAPIVNQVQPVAAPPAGGGMITLTGKNFLSGATVSIGGTSATNVVVASATKITCTVPMGKAGIVALVVTNPNGLTGSAQFTYYASALGFGAPSSFDLPSGTQARLIAIADIDGMSGNDILVTADGAKLLTYLNTGNGVLAKVATMTIGSGSPANGLLVTDIDGNGHPDVITATQGSPYDFNVMLDHNGDGTFQAPVSYKPATYSVSAIASGDFDGDGHPDIAFSDAQDGVVGLVINDKNNPGAFKLPAYTTPVSLGGYPYIAVGSYNSSVDSKLDLIVEIGGPDLLLFTGRGNGTFNISSDLIVSAYYLGPTLDLNGDGITDLTYWSGAGYFEARLGKGDGTFPTIKSSLVGPQQPQQQFADMNLDGKPDLVVMNGSQGFIDIYLGNGDGTFSAFKSFATNFQSNQIAIGDIDGDGLPDVACLYARGGSVPAVAIFINGST